MAMRSRTPENAKADRAFSQAVRARDGGLCRMERWKGNRWVEHGIKASQLNPLDSAHIFGRPHLSKATRFDARIGILACRNCHTKYDAHDDSVRVPPHREFIAYQVAKEGCKVPPVRRLPPERP